MVTRDVVSAGAVVLGPRRRVLLVHRPKYDDWSFPKGKLDSGERSVTAAVREVEEETGLRVGLGPPLRSQRYPVSSGMKNVHYWIGHPLGETDVSGYEPNAEIDGVEWVDLGSARDRLTYAYDRATLREARSAPRKTRTLVVLRHGVARAKKAWRGDDRLRPLLSSGRRQAERLAPVLEAYDVRRLVSSSSARCAQTLEPFAEHADQKLELTDVLSEEDASRRGVRRLVEDLVDELESGPAGRGGVVVCTHRPVLPMVFDAVGIDDPRLEKGELVVLHLRKGRVRALERHQAG